MGHHSLEINDTENDFHPYGWDLHAGKPGFRWIYWTFTLLNRTHFAGFSEIGMEGVEPAIPASAAHISDVEAVDTPYSISIEGQDAPMCMVPLPDQSQFRDDLTLRFTTYRTIETVKMIKESPER